MINTPPWNKDVVVADDVESPKLQTHEIPYKGSTSFQDNRTHHAVPSNDSETLPQYEAVIDAQESPQNRLYRSSESEKVKYWLIALEDIKVEVVNVFHLLLTDKLVDPQDMVTL
ncbi:hypothetical protein ACH5RR_015548 [Cinchona calisaya]|uniref:Uncharacterized protein n=1 Tax=Cinchona calisaya TaxID=153742 RepID=A0ABD2ZTH3_9GENT